MPQAVAAFISWLGSGSFWASVAKFVIKVAIAYGISRALTRKSIGALTSGSPLDMRMDPMAPQRVIYGETGVGPVMRFRHTNGTDNANLWLIYVWAGHECEAVTAFQVDGQTVSFDGAGNAIGTYAGVMRVTHHLGAYNQAADANFVAELGALWTSNDRWQGRCYSAIKLTWDQKKYPTSLPRITAVIKGRKVYDWRDGAQDIDDPSTWVWSDNAALCTADYIRGVPQLNGAGDVIKILGVGAEAARLPATRWIAEANACDEAVALAAGGTQKRYTCNGCFDTDAAPPNVLDALALSMAGKVVPVGADFYPFAGVWHTPDFTIEDSMLRGEPVVACPLPRQERIGIVKGTFIDPSASYERNDFKPWVDTDAIDEDAGELTRDIDLAFTNTATMARRIAKIIQQRSRYGKLANWPANLGAVPALTGENVLVTSTEFSWTEEYFEVYQFDLSVERGADNGQGMAIGLVLQQTSPAIYDWTTAEESAATAPSAVGRPDPKDVPVPAGMALTTSNFVQPDGTISPRLKVTCTAPTNAFVLSGGKWHLEYKKHADSVWLIMAPLPGATTEAYITDVQTNVSYDVRSAYENSFYTKGAYCTTVTATVSNDATAPATPTGLAATAGPGCIILDWSDNTETDLDQYELWRSTTNTFGSATKIWSGYTSNHSDFGVTPGVTNYYWLKALDTTGNASGATSSVNAAANSTTGAPGADGGTVFGATSTTLFSMTGYNSSIFAPVLDLTVSIPTGPRLITCNAFVQNNTTARNLVFELLRDATIIKILTNIPIAATPAGLAVSLSCADNPGAGTYTYHLKVKCFTSFSDLDIDADLAVS